VQQSFASPEAATKALADAVRAKDAQVLLAVVGPLPRPGSSPAIRWPIVMTGRNSRRL